ncbi:MAG: hypothetical protein M3299_08150, partial [Thermoproteota archaeon]|nr:hypothetical protein [Thermoproteota archaeon]
IFYSCLYMFFWKIFLTHIHKKRRRVEKGFDIIITRTRGAAKETNTTTAANTTRKMPLSGWAHVLRRL